MIQLTASAPRTPDPRPPDGRAPARAAAVAAVAGRLLGGAMAAGLGLGLLAVVVLLLWVASPYPGGDPSTALRIAADVWLVAHGAHLTRPAGPIALTPLLLALLPAWLLHRATRHAVEAQQAHDTADAADGPGLRDAHPAALVAWVCAGYLAVGSAAVVFAARGPLPVHVVSAALALLTTVPAVASLSCWSALGRPAPHTPVRLCRLLDHPRTPAALRALLTRERAAAAARASGAGAAALVGGGALLLAVSLVWHSDGARHAFTALDPSVSGGVAVLLLSCALTPNAAVWAASYALGPGFTLAEGATVGPLAAGGAARLPDFPLLAALPGGAPPAAPTPLAWVVVALPVTAAVLAGWSVGRAETRGTRGGSGATVSASAGWQGTVATVALAACGCGALVALLTALAAGSLGTGALAHVGPSWWQTGGAALVWTFAGALPTALARRGLALRALRVRGSRNAAAADARRPAAPRDVTPQPPGARRHRLRGLLRRRREEAAVVPPEQAAPHGWHTTASRRVRWAALKESSGGLVPDFDPRRD